MDAENIKLEDSWKQELIEEFQKPYMKNLKEFLKKQIQGRKKVFPRGSEYFAALNTTPISKVKVVILGQDPYHGVNQAHGLCFSVRPQIPPPPSLINIFKELHADLKTPIPNHGYLMNWAKQGVLLLNATLTVEAGKAGSHQGRGWEEFTDQIIHILNSKREKLVFVLWGSYAQKKGQHIDTSKHLVIKSPHPSPLSAHRGFMGSRPFSQINQYLQSQGMEPIDWSLPSKEDVLKELH